MLGAPPPPRLSREVAARQHANSSGCPAVVFPLLHSKRFSPDEAANFVISAFFHPETGFLTLEASRLSQVVAVSTSVVPVAMRTAVSGVVAVRRRPVTAELRP